MPRVGLEWFAASGAAVNLQLRALQARFTERSNTIAGACGFFDDFAQYVNNQVVWRPRELHQYLCWPDRRRDRSQQSSPDLASALKHCWFYVDAIGCLDDL